MTQIRPSGAVSRSGQVEGLGGVGGGVGRPAAEHQHGRRDRLGRQRPRVLDVSGGDDLVEQRQERQELAPEVLVAGRAEDQRAPRRRGSRCGGSRPGPRPRRRCAHRRSPAAADGRGPRPAPATSAPRSRGPRRRGRPPAAAATSARTSRPARATAALWAWCGPSSGSVNVPQSVRQVRAATRNGVGRVSGQLGRDRVEPEVGAQLVQAATPLRGHAADRLLRPRRLARR